MNDKEFKAFLCLLMCSDPWPSTKEEEALLLLYADRIAVERGYANWTEAFHFMGPT